MHLRCDAALDPIADDPRFRQLLITPEAGGKGGLLERTDAPAGSRGVCLSTTGGLPASLRDQLAAVTVNVADAVPLAFTVTLPGRPGLVVKVVNPAGGVMSTG